MNLCLFCEVAREHERRNTDISCHNVEIAVGSQVTVSPNCAFYGTDENGVDKWVSADLLYFSEGGAGYAPTDYDRALTALQYSTSDFGYLIGGGTRSTTLISKLVALGIKINTTVLWDVPGDLNPAEACQFYDQIGIDSHYSHAFYAPFKSTIPLIGGKGFIGTSCDNAGMRCGRNAVTDNNGVAPKNYPVAGKAFPLTRNGMVQSRELTDKEKSDLAKTRINLVAYVTFTNGGNYIFTDSLTGAKTENARKLIAVSDMSVSVDDIVTKFAKECLQLPMLEGIKRMQLFLQQFFGAIETAKWIKPSTELSGRSFRFLVRPNSASPDERMDIEYWLHFDGTVRVIHVQQTRSK